MSISDIVFSPHNKIFAVDADGADSALWSVTDPEHPVRLAGLAMNGGTPDGSLAFSPDGRLLYAVNGRDTVKGTTTMKVFDVTNPTHPATKSTTTIARNNDDVGKIAVSADGHTRTFRRNGNIDIWATESDKPTSVVTFPDHGRGTLALNTSVNPEIEHERQYMHPSDNYVAQPGLDGIIDMWDLDEIRDIGTETLRAACASLPGDTTIKDGDWEQYLPGMPRRSIC
ncbi:WD40 repeat domain-containing protein [Nocardia sp. CA2R105]|uniref:WD40 repeat domain-containing protein n=1 Tax=Nocardia coffeae TaxID=2873381 RepID=UPI001CA620ED|nr:WD40 repeat domain-containing protein [Nocardia coffeae]MBY8861218.1 WD40 repeat domain-containing protein [Nocardia coffeae]